MKLGNDLWGMDQVEAFVKQYPQLSSEDIDLLERFQYFCQSKADIESIEHSRNIEAVNAANETMRVLMEAIDATRWTEDEDGPVEKAWLTQPESDQIKKIFMQNIDALYGTNLQNLIPNGN